VVFFSCSSGKRGLYVLPAVPALVLASVPYLRDLLQRRGVQRLLFALASLVAVVCAGVAVFVLVQPQQRAQILGEYGIDPLGPAALMAVLAAAVCAVTRVTRGHLAFAGVLTAVLLVVSYWVNPQINAIRSGAALIAQVEDHVRPGEELGWFGFREQYLLSIHRPVTHFGQNRWAEGDKELADAALWLASGANRALVINEWALQHCFSKAEHEEIGQANRRSWYVVRGEADAGCSDTGNPKAVFNYIPPGTPR
jgi:hypothetical protein